MHRIARVLFTLALLAGAGYAIARSTGPPVAKTQAPAIGAIPQEGICTDCHIGAPLNGPTGQLELLDLPEKYTPGVQYELRVRLRDFRDPPPVNPQRWGFQCTTARADSGLGAGTFAVYVGTGDPADSLQILAPLQTSAYKSRRYMEHRFQAIHEGEVDTVYWRFKWTAPLTDVGKIYFFLAGNAADGSGTANSGDHIFTTRDSIEFQADTTEAVSPSLASGLSLAAPRPNPVRSTARFEFVLPHDGAVEFSIVDIQGRRARSLVNGWMPAGRSSVTWDGRMDHGGRAPHGQYFLRLATEQGEVVGRRITVAR